MAKDFQQRAKEKAAEAVGKEFKVRIDPRTKMCGTITKCQFIGTVPAGKSERPQYEITMACGSVGAIRTFVVTKLP